MPSLRIALLLVLLTGGAVVVTKFMEQPPVCDAESCVLPDCSCGFADALAEIPRDDLPQFILVTFDDAVNDYSQVVISAAVGGLENPPGRPAPVTYFVTKQGSQARLIRELYAEGHEFANHTAYHTTETSVEGWIDAILEVQEYLIDVVGIPADQIVGFRAPYLETNAAMVEALQEIGYLYDSSSIAELGVEGQAEENSGRPPWPHTHASGLWSVPMWSLRGDAGTRYVMDPGRESAETFANVLERNFELRYEGDRTPLGIYLHASEMRDNDRQRILRRFLEEKVSQPDVWMVTTRGLVEWMRHPVPASAMEQWLGQGCDRGWCAEGVLSPPPAIGLENPGDRTFARWNPTHFRWEAHSAAGSYRLQVAASNDFSTPIIDEESLVGVEFSAENLPPDVPLYWRVRGSNPAGYGEWSETRRFVVPQTFPESAVPSSAMLIVRDHRGGGLGTSPRIAMSLKQADHVLLKLHDFRTATPRILAEGFYPAGLHSFVVDASWLGPRPFVIELETETAAETQRITIPG